MQRLVSLLESLLELLLLPPAAHRLAGLRRVQPGRQRQRVHVPLAGPRQRDLRVSPLGSAHAAQSFARRALRVAQRNRLFQLPLPRLLRRLRRLLGRLLLATEVLEEQVDRPGLPLALGELHDAAAPHATAGLGAAGGVLQDPRVALEGGEVLAEVETVAVERTREKRLEGILVQEGERLGGRLGRGRGRGNRRGGGRFGTEVRPRNIENRGSDFVVIDVALDSLDVLRVRGGAKRETSSR